jgi:hypothetical protein
VASFTASGATTYTLSTGDSGTSVFTVTPTSLAKYTLTGVDANACSNSSTLSVEVNPCTGLSNYGSIHTGISVFPNPSAGLITAKFEFEGVKLIQIFNEIGQCLETRSSKDEVESFDLTLYAKGIYFVKINSKQASGNFRVVIQ